MEVRCNMWPLHRYFRYTVLREARLRVIYFQALTDWKREKTTANKYYMNMLSINARQN